MCNHRLSIFLRNIQQKKVDIVLSTLAELSSQVTILENRTTSHQSFLEKCEGLFLNAGETRRTLIPKHLHHRECPAPLEPDVLALALLLAFLQLNIVLAYTKPITCVGQSNGASKRPMAAKNRALQKPVADLLIRDQCGMKFFLQKVAVTREEVVDALTLTGRSEMPIHSLKSWFCLRHGCEDISKYCMAEVEECDHTEKPCLRHDGIVRK